MTHILQVGSGKAYSAVQAAVNAAVSGDEIQIDAGEWLDELGTCYINKPNLAFRGIGGRAHIRWTRNQVNPTGWGSDRAHKGLWLQEENNTTLDNIEFSMDQNDIYATNIYGFVFNGGLAGKVGGVTARDCYFHGTNGGIKNGYTSAGVSIYLPSDVILENCEFSCPGHIGDSGQDHNIYVGWCRMLKTSGCYYHGVTYAGHLLKSRAEFNYILHNRFDDEDLAASACVSLENGGYCYVIGNTIYKGTAYDSHNIISFAQDFSGHGWNTGRELYAINNTVIAKRNAAKSPATFIVAHVDSSVVMAENNLYITPDGLWEDVGKHAVALTTNLKQAADPGFVNINTKDYHLTSGATGAVDQGALPAMNHGFICVPTHEYGIPPTVRMVKGAGIDIGAYEL